MTQAKAQSIDFIMNDWVSTDLGQEFNHQPGGSNVLYMDGHVSFTNHPGFPGGFRFRPLDECE